MANTNDSINGPPVPTPLQTAAKTQATRNRVIEYTQAAIAIGVIAAYLFASFVSQQGADQLKDLALIILPFYFVKRADYAARTDTTI